MTVLKNTTSVIYCAELPENWSLFAKVINSYKKFWLTILCAKILIRPSL